MVNQSSPEGVPTAAPRPGGPVGTDSEAHRESQRNQVVILFPGRIGLVIALPRTLDADVALRAIADRRFVAVAIQIPREILAGRDPQRREPHGLAAPREH